MNKFEPETLLLDIETTPLRAYSWGPAWETNLIEIIEHTRILSFSAKWLGGEHITKGWPNYKGYKKGSLDDRALINNLWELMDKAQIIVAHNGKDFDIKIANARFAVLGFTPPSPYKVVDTKTEAKKYLRLPSNKLNDLCDYFGIGRKVEHEGFPLWTKCMSGDSAAWRRMLKYNKQDVVLLEQLYLKLRPWMVSHPNAGMYTIGDVCPKCGSDHMTRQGYSITKTAKYQQWQCQCCGSWARSTHSEDIEKPLIAI